MHTMVMRLLALGVVLLCLPGLALGESRHVERQDWADDVKNAINDFIDLYGNTSAAYSNHSYVVTDFDNTTSIFDTCEQLCIYQAEVMAYGFTPEELPAILASGLDDMNRDLSNLGYGHGCYNDWISDITTAYTYLYNTYGPFTPEGVSPEDSARIQADVMWPEFIAKMMNLYLLIGASESTAVSYPWITYWFTGMTEEEVYNLARASHRKYGQVDTAERTIATSGTVSSRVGMTEYTYVEGVQVTENIREMWQKLHEAGIDIWVCSASESNIIRAAVDEFGLHEYCTGLIGMTPTIVNGKMSYTYDYETGYCWYAGENGEWTKGHTAAGAQTQGIGKVVSVQNICVEEYGCGPLAGFMDSTGDYNFCTEFDSLKLVVCFNRGDRKVTDGGSVIAEVAIYQRNVLGYDLTGANAAGDTLYVLQGRDENGIRTFRNSNASLRLNCEEEQLFRNEQNDAVYAFIAENHMTTEEAINTFALKTDEDAQENSLGFSYGFLETYSGYHSR